MDCTGDRFILMHLFVFIFYKNFTFISGKLETVKTDEIVNDDTMDPPPLHN
jgi:hypothetical protein